MNANLAPCLLDVYSGKQLPINCHAKCITLFSSLEKSQQVIYYSFLSSFNVLICFHYAQKSNYATL